MTKQELADAYGISTTTLRKLLNKRYYERLLAVGYNKHDNFLSPRVIREFYSIYGKPLSEDDN